MLYSCYNIDYLYGDVWFHVTEIGIHIGIYLMLMLQLYNCTRIYIVKYRQSIAFGIIYICGVFLGSCEGGRPQKTKRKSHKLLLFVVLNIMLCSLDINISAVCTTALGKRQEWRYPWKTHQYHLQHVQFVASQLTIFTALPRTMDRSNAKLGEGVKRLFYGLLAVFCIGKLSMQWKRIRKYCLQQRTLFALEWILFCLD